MERKIKLILMIIIPIIAAIIASSIIQGYISKDQIQTENNTRFFVINKTKISIEKPVNIQKNLSFRIIIQNHENKGMKYRLKIIFDENIILDKNIKVVKDKTYNRTLSLNLFNFTNSSRENRYLKLEFRLYNDDKLYGVDIFSFPYRRIETEKNTNQTIGIGRNQSNYARQYKNEAV